MVFTLSNMNFVSFSKRSVFTPRPLHTPDQTRSARRGTPGRSPFSPNVPLTRPAHSPRSLAPLTPAPHPARARPQSLKGVSGEVIILEEAAYCDQGLVAEVVVPLLSMQSSVLLCISTLLDGGNHYVSAQWNRALSRRHVSAPRDPFSLYADEDDEPFRRVRPENF